MEFFVVNRLDAVIGVLQQVRDGRYELNVIRWAAWVRQRKPALRNSKGNLMIIIGILLLLIGFLAKIAIVWTLGIIALIVGLILLLLGSTGRAVRGRRHYW